MAPPTWVAKHKLFSNRHSIIHIQSTKIKSVQFNPAQFNSVQLNSIQFSSVQLNSIQLNSIQFNSTQFNSTQFNPTQLNSSCNAHSNTPKRTTLLPVHRLCSQRFSNSGLQFMKTLFSMHLTKVWQMSTRVFDTLQNRCHNKCHSPKSQRIHDCFKGSLDPMQVWWVP